MRIASKINAALFGAFACGLAATYGVLATVIQPRFEEIERAEAAADHKRVTEAFNTFTEKLETATQDYAYWDETYAFVSGTGGEDFIASNMTPAFSAIQNLGVNALIFLANDGTMRWGAAFDLETREPIEGLIEELAHFSRSHPAIARTEDTALRGIIRTSKGLVLVALAPVLQSDRTGEAVGKVLSGKLLDVEAAKKLTRVELEVLPLEKIVDHAALPETMSYDITAEHVVTTSVVRNIVGRPLKYLKVYSSREVSRAGAMAIRSAMLMMLLAGIISIGVLWMYLRRAFVARVEALKSHFVTAGSSGKIATTELSSGTDEISAMATSFNGMAEQVNHLRDALADSAYMTGLSEWAAGTLHNVRNGLAPVAAKTWKIEQLFDPQWVKNIEAASREHGDPATPAERRQKLNQFLVGTAGRVGTLAQEACDLAAEVNGASQSVLDMVAEFEQYAHRKTEFEAVDLLELLQQVKASVASAQAKDVDIVMPPGSATLNGNGVILRQVFSNLIINAAEAIKAKGGKGRIEIAVEPVKHGTATRIAFKDDGEGIAADRLDQIFKRGESTRKGRKGGLGLHWCANAVRIHGGQIHAESDGPGAGTTMVLELPNIQTRDQMAA